MGIRLIRIRYTISRDIFDRAKSERASRQKVRNKSVVLCNYFSIPFYTYQFSNIVCEASCVM